MHSLLKPVLFGCAMLMAIPIYNLHASPLAKNKEQEAKEKREKDLFGNISALAPSQQKIGTAAALGNKNASTASKLLGARSIRNGVKHIRHGRISKNRPEVRLGFFEVLQGVLGLLAAKNAQKLADKDQANVENLVNLSGAGRPMESGSVPASVSGASGTSPATWNELKLDLAKDVDAKNAFAEIEEEYGITQEALLEELENGKDGRLLLVNAEKNPETGEDATASLKEARAKISSDPADAAISLGESTPSLGEAVLAEASSERAAAPTVRKKSSLRDRLSRNLASLDEPTYADDLAVSPEVQAALDAQNAELERQREREARAGLELTIFDMVRGKYKAREAQIRGW